MKVSELIAALLEMHSPDAEVSIEFDKGYQCNEVEDAYLRVRVPGSTGTTVSLDYHWADE